MLNALKKYPEELMSVPGTNKELTTKHVELSIVTGKATWWEFKNICSTHCNQSSILKVRQEVDTIAPAEEIRLLDLNCTHVAARQAGIKSYVTAPQEAWTDVAM